MLWPRHAESDEREAWKPSWNTAPGMGISQIATNCDTQVPVWAARGGHWELMAIAYADYYLTFFVTNVTGFSVVIEKVFYFENDMSYYNFQKTGEKA